MSAMKLRAMSLCLIMALGACLLPACSGAKPHVPDDLEKSFADIISVTDLNQSLQVRLLSGDPNEARFGRTMKIVVENISDKPIFLGVNPSPIMLFVIQDGKWAQIRNEVTYISSQGGEGFVLHPKAEDPNTWIPAVHPSFGSVGDIGNERVILRILAVGEFMANGQRTGIRVGAYADSFIRQP